MQTRKITIIGAGIVGIATASYLRRDGHEVTVVDQLPPGEYCSFGNAGILSPGSCIPIAMPGILGQIPGYLLDPLGPLSIKSSYFPRVLPWLLRFLATARVDRVQATADALRSLLVQTFDAYAPLVHTAGVGDLIHKSGYVVAYSSREAMQGDALGWQLRRERGVVMDELDGAQINSYLPDLKGNYKSGLFLHDHGWCANPERLTKALASQFVSDGVVILQRKVLAIDVGATGPRALWTDDGRLPVEHLIICAGAHSNQFTQQCGDSVPLEAERGYHITYSDPRFQLAHPIMLPEYKCFVTPMEMGLRIAGHSEFAGIDAPPNDRRFEILETLMQRMFPGIRSVDSTRWMGRRPSMPDSMPVIGRSSQFANTFYAFGHGHVGLVGGAPTGRLMADLIAGRPDRIDLKPFSVNRFK